jgi:CBS domain containing-hemolysin-like protein
MWLEILIWFGFVLVACLGNIAQTVSASVNQLQTSVLSVDSARVQRVRWLGGGFGAGALASAAALAVLIVMQAGGDARLCALGAGLSTLVISAFQFFARIWARNNLEQLARPLLGDAVVFLPFVDPSVASVEPSETSDDALEQMVNASEKVGLIESDQREMITGILQLDRTLTREIMVPRIDVIALNVETPLRDALDVVIAGAHSRVPVFEESIDHIIGVLYAKDALKTLRDGKGDISLRELMRPPHFVPESKPVNALLEELQSTKVHMAIVVDEYGGTAGIVTIEDVLEEIVGEIQDEYDTGETPMIQRVAENEAVCNTRATIDDVNEALGIELPKESDTLGGLVYQHLEKMPKVGDQVRLEPVTISVTNVVGRRIKQVRVLIETNFGSNEDTLNEERAIHEN